MSSQGGGGSPASSSSTASSSSGPPSSPVPSSLTGVRYGALDRHADGRGSFRELWRASAFPALTAEETGAPPGTEPRFVQANLSTSATGVLRGLHYHRRQLDYWVVLSGAALVALVDVRPLAERTGDRAIVETRRLDADDWVVIPAGVAHGFLALEPLELLYLVTNEFDNTDELGFAWDDPAVGVPWPAIPGTPDGRPILSDRDRSNPSLAQLVASLRA
jgi:dTDP-4-dehydrorhamnose 3,5-epimerase